MRMLFLCGPAAGCGSGHLCAARGSRPAGGHFLLLAQEKVTKEKSLEYNIRSGSLTPNRGPVFGGPNGRQRPEAVDGGHRSLCAPRAKGFPASVCGRFASLARSSHAEAGKCLVIGRFGVPGR